MGVTGPHPRPSGSSRGIIFIASQYDWMKPYAQKVLRDLWNDKCHLVVALWSDTERAEFEWLPAERVHFVKIPSGWFRAKAFQLYPRPIIRIIERLVAQGEASVALSMTIDRPLGFYLPRLQRRFPTIYITHNVVTRMSKINLRDSIYSYIWLKMPLERLVRLMRYKITNAHWQKRWLEERFPRQRVAYLDFPSLVTDEIAAGRKRVPELEGVDDYILFFGMVQTYKGVEGLVKAYAESEALRCRKLVIAGKGHLQCDIPAELSDSVIRINRYVGDDEITDLFTHAAVVVYPYILATQSGVLSIASYYGKPMVLSDIDYFRELAADEEGITIVDVNNRQRFVDAINDAARDAKSTADFYRRKYSTFEWRDRFDEICDEFFQDSRIK